MKDVEIIGMLKSYVSKSLVGMGALKGANCQIESIAEVTGGQKITFLWIDTNNVSHRSELTVPNGADGVGIANIEKTSTAGLVDTYTITLTDSSTYTFTVTNGAKGDTGDGIARVEKTGTEGLVDTYTITMTSGATATFTVTNGAKGDPGDDGFSPTIVEDPDNTDEIYKLDITDVNGTIVTPNLKGGGSGGTTNYNALNNLPQINSVTLTGNKGLTDLGIDIPTKTSDLTNDSNFVTDSELGTELADYTPTTQLTTLLADKVDKVSGKGLSTNDYSDADKAIVDSVTSDLAGKVDKETGKGLSTNDFTTALKNKLDGIESGAEVNVIEEIQVNGTALTPSGKAVNIELGINDLTDVDTTGVTDGQVLAYNSTTGEFEPATPTSGGVTSIAVNGVSQIISSGAVDLDVATNLITEAQWTQIQALLT